MVCVFFAVVTSHTKFVGFNGTASWLNMAAELGIIALAVGLLMIAGELDLSIGSVLGASSILLAVGCTLYGVNVWVMIVITLGFGAAVGLLNGLITARTNLPSFIEGQGHVLSSPREAHALGIATVHQDVGSIPLMSVGRNFFLGPNRRLAGARSAVDLVKSAPAHWPEETWPKS